MRPPKNRFSDSYSTPQKTHLKKNIYTFFKCQFIRKNTAFSNKYLDFIFSLCI